MKRAYWFAIGFLAGLLLVILLATTTGATAGNIKPPGECQAGEVCHWLMTADSGAYILCGDGRFSFEVYGHDAILVSCDGATMTGK